MAKQIIYDIDARQKLTEGMEALARAVRATLGPTGKNVILDKKYSRPHSTKDGVTVSKEVELPDPFHNMGAKIINEVASRTNDKVGDGTTTAVIFADALMNYTRDSATRTRAHAAARAFRDAIAPTLASPNDAERSLLATHESAHPRLLDDTEIGSNALIVLFGGIETTEGLIANALWAMFLHPEALERARRSDDDLERCIEESLRWEPVQSTDSP